MANAIENKVSRILQNAGVTFTVALVGATLRDKWECDEWRITFAKDAKQISFPYYTGKGHRKSKLAIPAEVRKFPDTLHAEAWRTHNLKPIAPSAACVLAGLTFDAASARQSFAEWCRDLDYDEDSRKAMENYLQCQETGRKLATVFDTDTRARLAEALTDY